MKKILQFFAIILLFVIIKEPEAQTQNWLIDTSIIPVTTGLWYGFVKNDSAMRAMRAVVDGITIDIGLQDGVPGPDLTNQMDSLIHLGFHIIPQAVYNKDNSTMYNWVHYYSDAHYTVWETEGIEGDTAYLQHDSNVMTDTTDGDTTFIRMNSGAACGEKTLMWGPYYGQYIYEINNDRSITPSQYTALFRMKLEDNPNPPPPCSQDTTISQYDPSTPICIIEVTQSKLHIPNNWTLDCTHVDTSITITLGQFKSYFFDFPLNYNLLDDSCQNVPDEPQYPVNMDDGVVNSGGFNFDPLKQRDYIQFKVIWLGNPYYLLSIDKVTVYDGKGYQLIEGDTTQAQLAIHNQLDQLSAYNPSILGWLGRDEPNSIDEYAPIKKVNEILNSYSAAPSRLWHPLMGKWDGRFNQPENPFGTYHISPWKEMKKLQEVRK
jgi:hypothetical protein